MSDTDQQDQQDDQRDADQQDQHQNDSHDTESSTEELGEKGREALRKERERAKTAEREKAELARKVAEYEKAKQDAEDAAAKEKGQWEEIAKKREDELNALQATLAERDLRDKRAALAQTHNLPADALEFVTGDDDASIEASVKKLAKLFAGNEDLDTDSGKRSATGKKSKQSESLLASYEFGKRR